MLIFAVVSRAETDDVPLLLALEKAWKTTAGTERVGGLCVLECMNCG